MGHKAIPGAGANRRPRPLRTIAAVCAALIAPALPAPASSETLAQAWDTAVEAHQRIAAAEAQRDAADLGLDSAKAERYPRLDLVSAFTQLDTAPRFAFGDSFVSPRLFSDDNFVTASAQVSLPLYTGGRIGRGIDAAESVAKAAQSQLETVTQDIKLGAAEHYINVLRAESAVAVARTNVTTLTSHTADARKQFELGAVPQNDFLAASVSLANAQQGELQAANRLDLARASYNRFLGRALTTPVALDERLSLDTLVPAGKGVDALIELAVANRGELEGLALHADALRSQSAAERASVRPQLALTGGYSLLENEVLDDERFWSVGVGLQWNLFDSGRSRNRAAALDRQASALLHERTNLETLIALEVRQVWSDRREAESRLAVAEAAVSQAMENLRVVRDRYQAGAGTNTEVLDAEALRAQSLSNRDNARFDVALASLRLARAIGEL